MSAIRPFVQRDVPLAAMGVAIALAGCHSTDISVRDALGEETGIRFVSAGSYAASTITSGGQAGAIAAADFNRDGWPDVAVSNCGGGGPSILLGTGNGGFSPPDVVRSDADACAVGAADLNHDGAPDLVAGSYVTGRVTILLGNGNGEFSRADRYPSGLVPMQFAIADFDGDGDPDIASMNYTPGTVRMLLGRGDGSFDIGEVIPAANMGISIFASDLDGDDDADLVVTEGVSSHPGDLRLGDVNVLLNNGNGTFQPRVGYTVGFAPEYVEAGDLDGDGRIDLVVGNALSFELSILYGSGEGTFEPEQRLPLSDGAPGIKLTDFDADGALDIAVIQSITSQILILQGDGDRHFSSVGQYATAGLLPESFAVTDLNGDHCADIVVPGNTPPLTPPDPLQTRVSVLLNVSRGCLSS